MEDDKDCVEFQKYHKNKYNRIIHIVSFLVGFSAIIWLLPYKYKFTLPMLYLFGIIHYGYSFTILLSIMISLFIIYFITHYSLNYISRLFTFGNKTIVKYIITFIVLIITFLIPEFSHYYFQEPTYLYNRIERENGFQKIKQIIKHEINLVPYCMSNTCKHL